MMSSPKSPLSASDFTESHAERACKEAKSTCAGADLPPEEEELKLEEGTLAAFCASVDIFVRSSGLLRCRWTLLSVKTLIERFAFFLSFFLWRRENNHL